MIKDSIVRKITAPNPGVFTGDGTNSYLVGVNDITLVDPGPAISEPVSYTHLTLPTIPLV